MTDDETWFEVKITYELAHVLQRIINVYIRTGRKRRAEMLARVTAAIGDPAGNEETLQAEGPAAAHLDERG